MSSRLGYVVVLGGLGVAISGCGGSGSSKQMLVKPAQVQRAFAHQGIPTFVANFGPNTPMTTISPIQYADQIEIYVFKKAANAEAFFTLATKQKPQPEIRRKGSAIILRSNVIIIFHKGQGAWRLSQAEGAASAF